MTLTEFIDTWIPSWVFGTLTMIVPAVVVLAIYRRFTRRLIRLSSGVP
jgi:hypothetical protein